MTANASEHAAADREELMPPAPNDGGRPLAEYAGNAARMRPWSMTCATQADRVREGGGAGAREKHLARGKLLPRDRVRALIDPASPFLEIGQLAAHGMYKDEVPSAGLDHRHRPRRRARMHDRGE
jgi:3-methylcrotonyl-CoA carboxylase beta subunit